MAKKGLYVADYFSGSGYGHVRRYQAFKSLLCWAELDLATQEDFEGKSKIINWGQNHELLKDQISCYAFIIIDTFTNDKKTIQIFENHSKPIFVDDFKRRTYRRGLVIDGTINAEKWRKKTGEESCYGLTYNIVRDDFYNAKQPESEDFYAFTFGGQDPKNYLPEFYKSAPERSIFFGTSDYPSYPDLKEAERIFWNTDVTDFINLILKSCLVISTAGQTLYELYALKKPFISIVFTDNHREDGEGFMKDYGMHCIVDKGNTQKTVYEVLCRASTSQVNFPCSTRHRENYNELERKIKNYLLVHE